MDQSAPIVLDWLWQTSWQTALLAIAVGMITRAFYRRLSPGAVSLLWMLVFVRLVMPVLPGSPMSIFALFKQEPLPEPVQETRMMILPAQFALAMEPVRTVPVAPAPEPSRWLPIALFAGWLGGAVMLIGAIVIQTIRFSRRLRREGRSLEERTAELVAGCCRERSIRPPATLLTSAVTTPAIFGVFRPRLLLPGDIAMRLTTAQLQSVILHELEHLRRRHLLSDWLFTLIKSLHWFNPAVWWSHRQIRAARELICDQAVLKNLDEPTSRQYGMTMLAMAGGLRATPTGVPVAAFARDYRLLKRRIEAIASKRRYLAGLGVPLAGLLALFFLTSPASVAQDPPPTPNTPATQPANPPPPRLEANSTARLRYAESDLEYKLAVYQRKSAGGGAFSQQEIAEAKADVERAKAMVELVKSEMETAQKTLAPTSSNPILRYPDQWPGPTTRTAAETDLEMIQRQREARDRLDRARIDEARRAQADATARAQLERVLPEVRLDNVAIEEVVEFLRDVSGANIFVNWRALEAAGVTKKTTVSARLRDVKFGKALETILRDAGGEKARFGYSVDEGVITISTVRDLQVGTVTQVYDIRDLIFDVNVPADAVPGARRAELVKAFQVLITDTIARDSWHDNGGDVGMIRELAGQLIVTQTPEIHQQIGHLLAQLREVRSIQIAVTGRMVDMSPAVAETLGKIEVQNGYLILDEKQASRLTMSDVTAVYSPKLVLFNGQNAKASQSDEGHSEQLQVEATVSSDRRSVTIRAIAESSSGPADRALRWSAPTHIMKVPDGHTALFKLDPRVTARQADGTDRVLTAPAMENQRWVAIKPSILLQRELHAEPTTVPAAKP